MSVDNQVPDFTAEVKIVKTLDPRLQNGAIAEVFGGTIQRFMARKYEKKDSCFDFYTETDLLKDTPEYFTMQIRIYNAH